MSTNTVIKAMNVVNTRNQKKGIAIHLTEKSMWRVRLEDGKMQEVTDATFSRWYKEIEHPVAVQAIAEDEVIATEDEADDDIDNENTEEEDAAENSMNEDPEPSNIGPADGAPADEQVTAAASAANAAVNDETSAGNGTVPQAPASAANANTAPPKRQRKKLLERTEKRVVGDTVQEVRERQLTVLDTTVTMTPKTVKIILTVLYRNHKIKIVKYGPTIQTVSVIGEDETVTYKSPKSSIKDTLQYLGVSEKGQNFIMEDLKALWKDIAANPTA